MSSVTKQKLKRKAPQKQKRNNNNKKKTPRTSHTQTKTDPWWLQKRQPPDIKSHVRITTIPPPAQNSDTLE